MSRDYKKPKAGGIEATDAPLTLLTTLAACSQESDPRVWELRDRLVEAEVETPFLDDVIRKNTITADDDSFTHFFDLGYPRWSDRSSITLNETAMRDKTAGPGTLVHEGVHDYMLRALPEDAGMREMFERVAGEMADLEFIDRDGASTGQRVGAAGEYCAMEGFATYVEQQASAQLFAFDLARTDEQSDEFMASVAEVYERNRDASAVGHYRGDRCPTLPDYAREYADDAFLGGGSPEMEEIRSRVERSRSRTSE